MLSFEEKCAIFDSFPELRKKEISGGKVNYEFIKTKVRGKNVGIELHPSGNGYINGTYLEDTIRKKYKLNGNKDISIKNFDEDKIRKLIQESINSMSKREGTVKNKKKSIHEKLVRNSESVVVQEDLVRSCLYNWLGYGNLNGEIWFIGTEEGGAEIWRIQTQTLESSLQIRSTFSKSMDFVHVWEELYKIPLHTFSGASVWTYMAYFLLAFECDHNNIHPSNYVFYDKKLGRINSNHFMCELLPLPKQQKAIIDPYKHIWTSTRPYYDEVLHKRFDIIKESILKSPNVKIIVSYERMLTNLFLEHFNSESDLIKEWSYHRQSYKLYNIRISENRKINFLSTPFFGNGQISYNGLLNAVKRLKE